VLVHCWAGVSRSCALVAAYLIRAQRLPVEAALARVRAARPLANPNLGFRLQLHALERRVLGAPSEARDDAEGKADGTSAQPPPQPQPPS
jgi:protein-tyrosine phosphatase